PANSPRCRRAERADLVQHAARPPRAATRPLLARADFTAPHPVLVGRERPTSTGPPSPTACPASCASGSRRQLGRDADLPALSEPLGLLPELIGQEDRRRRIQPLAALLP